MVQIWENFVIEGGGGCECCGATCDGPLCAFECHRTGTLYEQICCDPGGCLECCDCYTTPIDDGSCTYEADCFEPDPDAGDCCPGPTFQSFEFRLYLYCLVIGENYQATAYFEGAGGATSEVSISFTASATEEFTPWQSGPALGCPDPSFWTLVNCQIVEV